MFYPDYANLHNEFEHTANETRQEGYMLNISLGRATALLDAAYIYEKSGWTDQDYVPNGNFSDAECTLWELFLKGIEAGIDIARKEM